METIIESLQTIANSPRILQPEQTIQLCLIPLRPYLEKTVEQDIISSTEKALLSLLKINSGDLNVACSISIGMNLCSVYKCDPHKHFWNLISAVTDSPTKATIIALKYVVSKLGSYNKSSLGKITQHLLTLKDQSLHYPSLLALRSLFKVCGQTVSKSAPSAFKFAKGYITNSSEVTQIAAIRLLEVLLVQPAIPIKKILGCAQSVFNSISSLNSFVKYTCASLVAKCAVIVFLSNSPDKRSGLSTDDDNNSQITTDFQINTKEQSSSHQEKESSLKKAFDILLQFKNQFSLVFSYFLDYLNPEYVYLNVQELFKFTLKNYASNVKKVTAFFGRDVRSGFFYSILKSKDVNISILNFLTYDENSARDTAGIAHTHIWSSNQEDRRASATFYKALAISFQTVALEELHVALHYIAMPPDDSPTSEKEYEGMATIASIILSSLRCSIEKERNLISRFIKYVLAEKTDSELYTRSLFMVIAPLKIDFFNDFGIEPLLEKQVESFIKISSNENPVYPIRLIEKILIFISIHPNYKIAKKFGEFAFSIVQQLSSVAILSLLRLFRTIEVSKAFALSLIMFFFNKVVSIGVPYDYIIQKIPVLMKIPEEVVRKHKHKKHDRESLLFFVDNTVLSSKIMDNIPRYFMKLSEEGADMFLSSAIGSLNKIAGMMCLLLILTNNQSYDRVPRRLHQMILSVLPSSLEGSGNNSNINNNFNSKNNNNGNNNNNDIMLQIAAECIAIHLSRFPDDIPDIYDVMKNENSCSCFIESAIARRLNLEDQQVVDIIFRTSKRIKNPSLTNYVLHELASIYEAKSVQMVSLLMGDQQMQQLLSLLCETRITSVYQMYLISACIEKLVPILLPNLGEKSTVIMVILALDNFRNSAVYFCKRLFFNLFRQIFAFSQNVARNFHVKLPQTSMRLESKLAACGALADLSRIRPFTNNLIGKIPPFIVLLQRTKDERIEQFLTAAAECFVMTLVNNPKNEDLAVWFHLPKQILSSNTMVGFGAATIEPNTAVKHCALCILRVLLPSLTKTEPLMTDCMDDTITSTLRAIESRKVELHEVSYEILTIFLDLFKDYVTDQNVKLLELYESQFSNATKYAFPDSMNVASVYLTSYLDFSFAEYSKNEQSCLQLIETFINSLSKVKERTSGFFAIASKLCVISETYEKVAEFSKDFLKGLTPLYLNLLKNIIQLRTSKSPNWEEITMFKDQISHYYADFLNSFIWLKKYYPIDECQRIDTPSLSSFLLLELTSSSEKWRSCSAFSAISSVLRYFGSELNAGLFELIVNTMCHVARWNSKLFTPFVPKFLKYATKHSSINDFNDINNKVNITSEADRRPSAMIWNMLCSAALNHRCNAETLGLILKNCEPSIIKHSISKFADLVVVELSEKLINEEEAIAIVTILFDMCQEAIPTILLRIFSRRIKDSVRFQMLSIERALKRVETKVAIDRIASFCCENFTKGGLETIAQITILRPSIGKELLMRGVVSKAVETFENVDGMSALHFFEMVLDNFKNVPIVAVEIAKAALVFLVMYGNERTTGEKLAATVIQIENKCQEIEPNAMQIAFEALSEEKKGEVMKAIKKWASKKVVKKVSLVKFSARPARRRNEDEGGWQSLDED